MLNSCFPFFVISVLVISFRSTSRITFLHGWYSRLGFVGAWHTGAIYSLLFLNWELSLLSWCFLGSLFPPSIDARLSWTVSCKFDSLGSGETLRDSKPAKEGRCRFRDPKADLEPLLTLSSADSSRILDMSSWWLWLLYSWFWV